VESSWAVSKQKESMMRRAVVVAGKRTPFNKAFGAMLGVDTIGLGKSAVAALVRAADLDPKQLDSLIWGGVVLPPQAVNVGREIVLDLGLPPQIDAMTVTRACASGLQSVTAAVSAIERGDADVVIAGGSDSTSNAAITLPPNFIRKVGPLAMGKRAGALDYLGVLAQLNPLTDILPKMPQVAERSTGETMGQSAERMAERNQITREAQDAFAVRSHQRAAAAVKSGRFVDEVAPLTLPNGDDVHTDGIIRGDTSVEQLAKLRPAFRRDGTITAGNASPLTDGAAAVLLMNEETARALGYTPLAAFRSWSYVGVDPRDQLLIGPALAVPRALDKAGLQLKDMDLVDMHEAFAAQVLSVLSAMASDAFARERLGRDGAVGEVDPERLNLHGGSLAIGHPFAATGARMVTTMANELHQGQHQHCLLAICAAGGLGAAAVMERV
jgi:acetyl-CoA acyltransferase